MAGSVLSTRTDADLAMRFRRAAGMFATGITVVTATVDGLPHGVTVNAFMTVSLEPLLVAVALRHGGRADRHIEAAGGYCVNVLSDARPDLVRAFAQRDREPGTEQFSTADCRPARFSGAPLLACSLAYFDCVVNYSSVLGDHRLFIGQVMDFAVVDSERTPLLFWRGECRTGTSELAHA